MNQAFSSQPDAGASAAPAPETAAPQGTLSLKRRVLAGTAWSLLGYGGNQAVRLGNNLILTRLLFPEAFGLMAIVGVCMQTLMMFSDAGLRGSIIHNQRGADARFVNTAWTVQVIRGFVIWGGVAVIAWPVARIYGESLLGPLLLVAGLSAIIRGFKSAKIFVLHRHIRVGRLTLIEVASQVMGAVMTIALAWWWQSVWALVFGGLWGVFCHTVMSHVALPGPPTRFTWCADAAKSLWRYGRWVLLSSGIGFLAGRGDVLLLGLFVPMDWLGIYAIAFLLSQPAVEGIRHLSDRVLFPMYAESLREQPEVLGHRLYRARLRLMGLMLPAMWMVMLFGQLIVSLLYDPRYAAAGWMLQILAAGAVFRAMDAMVAPVLLAAGDSYRMMLLQAMRAAVMVVGIIVAGLYFDAAALVVVVALVPLVSYPMLVRMVRRYGVWFWSLDLIAFAGTAAVAVLAWWLTA